MSEHFRLTARQSLEHPWLEDEDLYIDVLQELETTWMRACLARRRWHRALNTLKAMHTMKKLTFPDVVPGWSISPSPHITPHTSPLSLRCGGDPEDQVCRDDPGNYRAGRPGSAQT